MPSPHDPTPTPPRSRVTFRLAQDASAGNADAWRRLYERLQPWLLQELARGRRPRMVEFEDIAQQAFVGLFDRLHEVVANPDGSVRGMLLTIARARVVDELRKEEAYVRDVKRTQGFGDGETTPAAEDRPDSKAKTPSWHARLHELAERLPVCLAELGVIDQQLVRLVVLEDQPRGEVRQHLAIQTDLAFRVRLSRAVAKLQRCLGIADNTVAD